MARRLCYRRACNGMSRINPAGRHLAPSRRVLETRQRPALVTLKEVEPSYLGAQPSIFDSLLIADLAAAVDNRIYVPFPVVARPHDDNNIVTANGGLSVSYRPADGQSSSNATMPAENNGACYLWSKGYWIIRLFRWGGGATGGAISVPFRFFPYLHPLMSGFYSTLPVASQSVNTAPNVTNLTTNIVTLSQMLQGVVAIGVTPTGNPMRFRFAASPAASNYDVQVAVNVQKIFTGAELPLGELNAVDTAAGPDACRVVRYTR